MGCVERWVLGFEAADSLPALERQFWIRPDSGKGRRQELKVRREDDCIHIPVRDPWIPAPKSWLLNSYSYETRPRKTRDDRLRAFHRDAGYLPDLFHKGTPTAA